MSSTPPLRLSPRLLAMADRLAVTRVAGAASGDMHDWLPLRHRWDQRLGVQLPDAVWSVEYLHGAGLDARLDGCVVQIVALDHAVTGDGPWQLESPDGNRMLAVVRFRIQRLGDDGFVQSEWHGDHTVQLRLRLGTRAALRKHARAGDGEAWAIRLYRLLEVVRDWTPAEYQTASSARS